MDPASSKNKKSNFEKQWDSVTGFWRWEMILTNQVQSGKNWFHYPEIIRYVINLLSRQEPSVIVKKPVEPYVLLLPWLKQF